LGNEKLSAILIIAYLTLDYQSYLCLHSVQDKLFSKYYYVLYIQKNVKILLDFLAYLRIIFVLFYKILLEGPTTNH
jgi:hypothetical protein